MDGENRNRYPIVMKTPKPVTTYDLGAVESDPSPLTPDREAATGIVGSRLSVSDRAYFSYLNQGRIDGSDQRHWFEAEAQEQGTR